MKFLIIFLGFFSFSQATFFSLWRKPTEDVVKESIKIESNEYLSPEDLLLYNKIYATNGFGYYPQLHYPTVYTQLPYQGISAIQGIQGIQGFQGIQGTQEVRGPIITHLQAVPANTSPIVVPEIQTEFASPVLQKEVIQEELPLLQVPDNFNNGAYVSEIYPSEIHLQPQVDGVPGQYSHSYALSDGTKVFEEGHLIKSSTGNEIIVKSGNYEYVKQNGEIHKVNWIADEGGFRILE